MNFIIAIPLFIANPQTTFPLKLHAELPHILLPIGERNQAATLLVPPDLCTGVNLGELEYHRAMATHHPELEESFAAVS